MRNLDVGQAAENLAKHYLEQQGLDFVTQNFNCALGELDLVFKSKNCWVFVEVKNRKNTHFGHPQEWVTKSKQKKVIKAAMYYLQKQKYRNDMGVRFDVVSIINLNPESIEWVPNAFITNG